MTPNPSIKFGILSVCFGSAAVAASLAAQRLESLLAFQRGYVLHWLDKVGLVKAPSPGAVGEWSSPGIFSLSDPLAVQWLTTHAICFAIGSMSLSVYADHRHEDTLYLSIGFILGAIAIKILSFPGSIIAMIIGAVAITVRRRGHRRRCTSSMKPPSKSPSS